MASSQKDSSPNMGAKKGGALKNAGALREGPLAGPKDAAFKDKAVDNMPNEGAPELSKKGVIGDLI